VALPALARVLGFEAEAGEGAPGEAAVREWLLAHGALLSCEEGGEQCVDCRASQATLFVPADENAVAHGDTELDVTDFLKRFE
jgi:hypothetical protein